MSRPSTLEQSLLYNAEQLLIEVSPDYEYRLLILEACAARIGGFDICEYWKVFEIEVDDSSKILDAAERLSMILSMIPIPASLILSGLSREPATISEKKKNGIFYTDFRLAQFVAEDCRCVLERDSKIVDIAAGSGILLAAVAELYYKKYSDSYNQWISECIYAFDLSEYALRGARIALSVHASSVDAIRGMCGKWRACDSLLADDAGFPAFDIVVGNPPWGRIKLSLHSFVNKTTENYHVYGSGYDSFNHERFLAERQDTLNYSRALKERYSLLGSAEPDMYMAFLQRAISILKPGGHLSYIVPAGIIRSLGTESLRRFLLERSEGLKYYLLDNKANYFEIDTRFKFVIVSHKKAYCEKRRCAGFSFEICKDENLAVKRTEAIDFIAGELEKIRPDLTVPECRSVAEKDLFFKICANGKEWKDAWRVDIAREVDMTNDRPIFHARRSEDDLPVVEGRMVQQFRFGAKAYVSGSGRSAKWVPSAGSIEPQYFVGPDDLNERLLKRAYMQRAGYCDIAGQTNERAMMSAAIPAGVVCGNKVPTIVFPGEFGQRRLFFFVGVTNSFVFDWMLRRVLSTTVNYFLLFSLPMPDIDLQGELAERIISLSKELSCMGSEYYTDRQMGKLRAELDAAVADAYGLAFSDLELLMRDFPLLDRRQPKLKGETRATYTRDLFLSIAEERFCKIKGTYTTRERAGFAQNAKAYIPTEMTELSEGGAE